MPESFFSSAWPSDFRRSSTRRGFAAAKSRKAGGFRDSILLFRIHDEERLMQEAFGQEWQAYARRSWRLIPFLY